MITNSTVLFLVSPAVVISTGATADSAAGTLQLQGGTSQQGQGGDVDLLGGQSTAAGTGGRILLGTCFALDIILSAYRLAYHLTKSFLAPHSTHNHRERRE